MYIKINSCPNELLSPVYEILSELTFVVDASAETSLVIKQGSELSVTGDKHTVIVTYSRKNEVFRALTKIAALLNSGEETHETANYSMLCYMIDESRNAVSNIESTKEFIRYLAMMGYDSLMLYTEDTFELPGYEYFGYMRGRYTSTELREIDDYAYSFGIELIPCVQTLAHLFAAIRWPQFADFKDNYDTLLVGDDRTYKFIRAILEECAKNFRSKRIHIGMDEAVDLGRGKYLTKNGYRNSSLIMIEHLNRVLDMCRELDLSPMIWSDTFFRESFGEYYVKSGEFAPEILEKIPRDVDMVYWDYYHDDTELLDHMMKLHTDMGTRTIFAGGSRKWDGFATNVNVSLRISNAQLDCCKKHGVDQVIVTAWGDCGAEASLFSALPGAVCFAEHCYGTSHDEAALDKRCRECFGMTFDMLMSFDLPNHLPGKSQSVTNAAKYLLYNDLFERLLDRHMDRSTVCAAYREHAEKLHALENSPRFGYAFKTLALLCDVLSVKSDMGWRLYDAYKAGDKNAMEQVSSEIPSVIESIDKFITAFREQWYKENKTFGFTVQELRIGGTKERLASVKQRLDDYISGKIDRIEELEQESLPISPSNDGAYINTVYFDKMFTAGILE